MSDIKSKSLTGLKWSFLDSGLGRGVNLLFGLALARILSPREFGLIGMLAIFIAVSKTLTDSGFTTALIRKNKCTEEDYSTVFYYNLLAGALLCALLFFSAPAVALFFGEPILNPLLKVLSFEVIIVAASSIQRTLFTKSIDFKTQAKVSVSASVLSGTTAIALALNHFGVWSLVALSIGHVLVESIMYWIMSSWRPLRSFSKSSFKELFGFGNKILIGGLLNSAFQNIYLVLIGKYFSAYQLGHFSKAVELRDLPSKNFTDVVSKVSFPALAGVQDDPQLLREHFAQYIRSTMLITCIMLFGLSVVSVSFIEVVLGSQWAIAAEYLQLLCIVGIYYPVNALNITLIMVKGRSDVILKQGILIKLISIPFIVLGLFLGIKALILLMLGSSTMAFLIWSNWAKKLVGYGTLHQFKDIYPSVLFSVVVVAPAALVSLLALGSLFSLLLQGMLIILCTPLFGELFKMREYLYLKAQLPYLMNRK